MDTLVQAVSNELRVSTIDLAAGFNVESRSVNQLVQKYMAEFLEFGVLYGQVGNGSIVEVSKMSVGGKGQKLAYFLNEDQCSFLGTLLRNSEASVKFKLSIIKSFKRSKLLLEENNILFDDLEFDPFNRVRDLYLADFGNMVKVGKSLDVVRRVRNLETGSGRSCGGYIVFAGKGHLEQVVLKFFKDQRGIGEFIHLPYAEAVEVVAKMLTQD